ncbi:hypothetical protein ACIRU3_21395 [Streptomyces sp. NPDC101151]|uniref:hypothetical protein n=1 Tax=Streptomyces sp. NPDC101151 TaxID=3366115 RepID=UPI0038025D37
MIDVTALGQPPAVLRKRTPIPVTDHDVKVDPVITPDEVIECTATQRRERGAR